MIELRPKTLRIVWLLIAAALFAGAGVLHQPLDQLNREYELLPAGNAALAKHPEMALLRVAPGGLRSVMINYLWMRSQSLHREGRHFDAMQLAELICTLQPRFPGVWQFQSWQLAWNISATANTPEERWHWVRAGIELLRDKGIAMNPNSLLLYKQLSWTFTSKIGDDTDEMHWHYKRVWARDMQELLGAPTMTTTAEAIAAFKLIADSPIDRDRYRPRNADIQSDERRKFIKGDPAVAALADDLAAADIKIDASLLRAYNFCTLDDEVDLTRMEAIEERDRRLRQTALEIENPLEKDRQLKELDRRAEWARVINDPKHKKALAKTLAFVRAQLLWGIHKMDPEYMHKLMVRLGPIDWRTPWSHGLYWSMYGVEHCKDVARREIDSLNTDRTLLTCLKTLTWQGRMDYFAPMADLSGTQSTPSIRFRSDWRFIDSTHDEYVRLGEERSGYNNEAFEKNPLDMGHINFLANSIAVLYIRGHRQQAEEYFNWVKKTYTKNNNERWQAENVDKFILEGLTDQEPMILRIATSQLTASLQMAMVYLAKSDIEAFEKHMNLAQGLHKKYHRGDIKQTMRLSLPPLEEFAAGILAELLVRPELLDFKLTLPQRAVLYSSMEQRSPIIVASVYDLIRRPVARQCAKEKLDFNKLFPPPRGLDAVRQRRAAQRTERQ